MLVEKWRKGCSAYRIVIRIHHSPIAGKQVNAAVQVDRCRTFQNAVLVNFFANGEDRAPLGFNKARIGDRASVVSHIPYPDIQATQTGVGFGVGSHSHLQTGGEDGLAGGG